MWLYRSWTVSMWLVSWPWPFKKDLGNSIKKKRGATRICVAPIKSLNSKSIKSSNVFSILLRLHAAIDHGKLAYHSYSSYAALWWQDVLVLDNRMPFSQIICDRIWKNPASTHTISNLRFHQKWVTGSIHYHIPLLALATSLVSVEALLRPCVSLECHWMIMAPLYWCLEGWTSHEGLVSVCYLQFGVLWAQERSSRAPNWTSDFQTPFCTPILSPPSFPHPPPLLLPPAISLLSRKNSLNFGCLKVIHPHSYS